MPDMLSCPVKIALASDHAGYPLKEKIKALLLANSMEVEDFGTHSEESMDYPETGARASRAVAEGNAERGILVCGTGLGMSYVANRFKGVRAALCVNEEFARLSREHNDANILVLAGRFTDEALAKRIMDCWFETPFKGGRHRNRIEKIDSLT